KPSSTSSSPTCSSSSFPRAARARSWPARCSARTWPADRHAAGGGSSQISSLAHTPVVWPIAFSRATAGTIATTSRGFDCSSQVDDLPVEPCSKIISQQDHHLAQYVGALG